MKTSAHQRYRKQDGTIVPGATTVLNLLSKPALVPWANRLGLQGIDVTRYVDDKASIGTLSHAIVTDWLMGIETDTSHYDQHQIDAAQNAALSFFEWYKKNPFQPIIIEGQFVSEEYGFGGTIDLYGKLHGYYTLIDLKTGSGIWPEYGYQIASYKKLLIENLFPVQECICLNIPRDETEAFKTHTYTILERQHGWEIFLHCLGIYNLKKLLKHK